MRLYDSFCDMKITKLLKNNMSIISVEKIRCSEQCRLFVSLTSPRSIMVQKEQSLLTTFARVGFLIGSEKSFVPKRSKIFEPQALKRSKTFEPQALKRSKIFEIQAFFLTTENIKSQIGNNLISKNSQ